MSSGSPVRMNVLTVDGTRVPLPGSNRVPHGLTAAAARASKLTARNTGHTSACVKPGEVQTCAAKAAVCSFFGKRLSNSIEVTIALAHD